MRCTTLPGLLIIHKGVEEDWEGSGSKEEEEAMK